MNNNKKRFLFIVLVIALLMPMKLWAQEPYAVLSDDNTTLTFYYDGNKVSRGGMDVEPFSWLHFSGWYKYKEDIARVIFDTSFASCTLLTSTALWFYGCENLTTITGIENLNTKNVTDMTGMFYRCHSLTSLDLSHFITSKVIYMDGMFRNCSGLTSLDVSHFDTRKVQYMYGMFAYCSSLTSLDVSGFITNNVRDMRNMFDDCSNLATIYCNDTWASENSSDMFKGCISLYGYDESKTDATYAKPIADGGYFTPIAQPYAVYDSGTLTFYYDENKASRGGMSAGPFNYDDVRWGGHQEDIANVVFDASLASCTSLVSTAYWFYGCKNLTTITGIENLKTENVKDMSYMFVGCESLTSLDVSNFNTNNVKDMSYMFYGCRSLTSLDVSHFNTKNVTDMKYMFSYCSSLTSLNVSSFNTGNVQYMQGMFAGCSGLTCLDLGGFKTDNVTDMSWLFYKCSGLTSLDLSGFKTDNVTSMSIMFSGCSGLTSLDVSGFKTDNVTYMGGMFKECSGLTTLDVSGFKTDNVTYMGGMFESCSGLTSLDVSGFKTDNVTDMSWMFYGCESLMFVIVGEEWNTSSVTNGEKMFYCCYNLIGGSGTFCDENHTDHTYACIDGGPDNPGYFTTAGAPLNYPYAALNDDNTVLTFYYDDQMSARNGMKIRYYWRQWPYWRDYSSCINTVVFDASMSKLSSIPSTSLWFAEFNMLTTITGIENLKTENVKDMSYMFVGCESLTSLDVSHFNTKNVTDMSNMFSSCIALTSLDLSNFNTNNVTNMQYLFGWCWALSTIYVSEKWNMSNVEDLDGMFNDCYSIIGGAGTTYHGDHSKYAHVDGGPDNPGYFTYKATTFEITYVVDGKKYKTYQLRSGDAITPEPEPQPVNDTYLFSGWSEIPEVMPAQDVIVTGTFNRHFNVGHLVTAINCIMTDQVTADDLVLFNMNTDNELNIGDVILIVKNILDYGGSVQFAGSRVGMMSDLSRYTAAQFELKIPSDVSIRVIHLVENMEQSHRLMYRQIDEETYAVVIYSLSNQLLMPDNEQIVVVETDGGLSEEMYMQNITAAMPTGEMDNYQSLSVTTDIQQIEKSNSSTIVYDLNGRQLSGRPTAKGIYIVNGRKVINM